MLRHVRHQDERMSERFYERAVIKVCREQNEEMKRMANRLLRECLEKGSTITGSKFARDMMEDAFEGKDITRYVEALLAWLKKHEK